jgi:3-vinyl bacteriochlorophyllide hydratase
MPPTVTTDRLPNLGPRRGPPAPPYGLYTPEQRARRDASRWTLVQGVLAPLQFVIMLGSLVLVVSYLRTGEGHALAHLSVIVKTLALYAIMVTGCLWEREVFGRYLFAPAFFWEDVVSMGVMALHTAYVVGAVAGWMETQALMGLALVAYGAYAVNAGQFVWKLRQARLGPGSNAPSGARAHP